MALAIGAHPADGALEPKSDGGISADPTMMNTAKRAAIMEGGGGIEKWKQIYYAEKFELKAGQPAPIRELRQAYFEGLNWQGGAG